jgi:hypothetical protein
MKDFTLTNYKKLLHELLANGYSFQTLQDFIQEPENKTVILRHDVDRKPENALVVAKIEKVAGIKASYYFRIVKESYNENVIKQIAEMGHEIGYHYENLSAVDKNGPQISQINADLISHRSTRTYTDVLAERLARIKMVIASRKKSQKESLLREKKEFRDEFFELAIKDFERNLEKLRKFYPVKTICMHGSPLSKWDNRDLWEKYDYRDYGIIAEPYFDIDFDEVLYLTDTGRRWDGGSVSIRDKVKDQSSKLKAQSSKLKGKRWLRFRHTWDIIEAAEKGLLPDKIMITTHPQRWTDNPVEWTKELVWQNVKNVVKYFYVRR